MAEKIYDNISEISKAIKELNKNAQDASRSTKSLNEDLKLDPSNVELASQRFDALNRELRAYEAYQQKLTEHERQLRAAQATGVNALSKLDKGSTEYARLEKELARYNEELNKTERSADKAATQVKRLKAAINGINAKKVADEQAEVAKKMKATEQAMDSLEKAGRRLQVVFALIAATMTKLIKSAVEQGTELYSLSKRYNTSVENIQKWNRALQLATGESDLFTTSLKVMSKGLSTIPVGRGVAYNNALKGIGVAFRDIRDLDPTAQFEAIIDGLKSVDNEALQSSYAIQLFGDSGQSIAQALAKDADAFDVYLDKASKFGIITQDSAKTLAELSFELEAAKSQLQVVAAQMAINLVPVMLRLWEIGQKFILPVLTGLTKGSWALWFALAAIIALKIIPVVIKWIISIRTAEASVRSLTIANMALQASAIGIMGIMGVVAFGIGQVAMQAERAQSALTDFADTANSTYGNLAASVGANVEQAYYSSTERTVNINVDIYGEGDTAISDEAAGTVAQLTTEQVQKYLGDLIK